MKRRFSIAIAAILTACGAVATTSNDTAESAPRKSGKAVQKPAQIGVPNFEQGGMAGCFDPSLSGYARQQAERIGGVPCGNEGANQGNMGGSWVGEYRGPFDGGTGVVGISRGRSGLVAEVAMFSDHGCGGSVSGPVSVQADRLVLTKTPPEGPQCRIVMTQDGSRLNVEENGCSYYHGRSCEFTGQLARSGSSMAATRAAPGQSATWIVGAWEVRGQTCTGDTGLIVDSDGTYAAGGSESGKWSLAGNVLSFTALETFVLGESGVERVQNPQAVRFQVLSRSANAFSARGPEGRVHYYVRCE